MSMIFLAYFLTFLAGDSMKISIYDINPYIRIARASKLRANYVIQRRVIFDYELIYLEDGQMDFMYDDRIYSCEPGQFILIRPGIPHSFHVGNRELSQPHIHFDMTYTPQSSQISISFRDMDRLSPSEQKMICPDIFDTYPKLPFISFSDTKQALDLFYSIISIPRGTVTLPQKAKLTELIYLLIRDNFPDVLYQEQATQYDVCFQIKAALDAGQGLTSDLADMEQQYAYSRYYLERQFKKRYGISLIAYRNEKRMQQAKKLLQTRSVTAVAEQLGFGSIYAFSRAYKKHFGTSPIKEKSSAPRDIYLR